MVESFRSIASLLPLTTRLLNSTAAWNVSTSMSRTGRCSSNLQTRCLRCGYGIPLLLIPNPHPRIQSSHARLLYRLSTPYKAASSAETPSCPSSTIQKSLRRGYIDEMGISPPFLAREVVAVSLGGWTYRGRAVPVWEERDMRSGTERCLFQVDCPPRSHIVAYDLRCPL